MLPPSQTDAKGQEVERAKSCFLHRLNVFKRMLFYRFIFESDLLTDLLVHMYGDLKCAKQESTVTLLHPSQQIQIILSFRNLTFILRAMNALNSDKLSHGSLHSLARYLIPVLIVLDHRKLLLYFVACIVPEF